MESQGGKTWAWLYSRQHLMAPCRIQLWKRRYCLLGGRKGEPKEPQYNIHLSQGFSMLGSLKLWVGESLASRNPSNFPSPVMTTKNACRHYQMPYGVGEEEVKLLPVECHWSKYSSSLKKKFFFWLCWVFVAACGLSVVAGATLHCAAQAWHWGDFFCYRARALSVQASVVSTYGLSSCGSWPLEGLNSCGA